MSDRRDRAFLAGLLLGVGALLALGIPALWSDLATRNDFAEFWAASRATLEGENVYDPDRWPRVVERLTDGRLSPSDRYGYPPYALAALAPLALLPLPAAAALWSLGGIAIAALALRWLLRGCGAPAVAGLLSGFALLASQPSLVTLAQGQWSFWLTAGLAAAVAAQRARRATLAGLALLSFAAKPHLFLFAGWAIARRAVEWRQRGMLLVVGSGIALLVASVVLLPAIWSAWWASAPSIYLAGRQVRTATLAGLFVGLVGPWGAALAALGVVALVIVALRAGRGEAADAVWPALSILAAPYVQAYDHVLLLVPLAAATGLAARRSPRRALLVALGGAALLVVVAPLLYAYGLAVGLEPLSALVPLAMFALVLVAGR